MSRDTITERPVPSRTSLRAWTAKLDVCTPSIHRGTVLAASVYHWLRERGMPAPRVHHLEGETQ